MLLGIKKTSGRLLKDCMFRLALKIYLKGWAVIRLGQLIRLTEKEIKEFRECTGSCRIPRTIKEYDQTRLLAAARLRKLALDASTPEECLFNMVLADIEEAALIDAVANPERHHVQAICLRRWENAHDEGQDNS